MTYTVATKNSYEVGDLFNGDEVLEVVDKGAFYELEVKGEDEYFSDIGE